jgi:hypothetical protein
MHEKQKKYLADSYLIYDKDEIKQIDITSSKYRKKNSVPLALMSGKSSPSSKNQIAK